MLHTKNAHRNNRTEKGNNMHEIVHNLGTKYNKRSMNAVGIHRSMTAARQQRTLKVYTTNKIPGIETSPPNGHFVVGLEAIC